MYLVKTPKLVQALWPTCLWYIPTRENVLYLTFDDGPIPEVTPWVLNTLLEYNARATFFCVGENVERNPDIFRRLLAEGHSAGNHTHNHLNGWDTETTRYLHNVRHCARLVQSNLFRPPYGRLRPQQRAFLERHYKIVFWDVLSGDFDPNLTAEQCLQNIVENARPGSIIVLHDSLKTVAKLRYVLPAMLEHFSALGYRFEAIPVETSTAPVRVAYHHAQ
ncbi:MAG: polysaccharide deacetylase family protein [Saprospiraceae bacterium]|jgi:peptidoglycan/xylan/chitin deacetylase (PgdA/CDA1 family)|nr:polysaccharide deacetylase family protein [Saprospiraceae bacterium]